MLDCLQLETIEAAKQENEIIATISLLSIGIKTVPQPVLRKKFADCGPLLMNLFEQYANSDNQNVLRGVRILYYYLYILIELQLFFFSCSFFFFGKI